MALFSFLTGKKTAEGQPRRDWPWKLEVDGQTTDSFSWDDVERGLRGLTSCQDSFLILEQVDRKDPMSYWFIQSAIAQAGDHAGQYIVGIGYSKKKGAALLERYCDNLEQVIPQIKAAYQGKELELSRFEDHSSWLPVNQKE